MEGEPSPTWCHYSALVEEKFCVWGGSTKDFRKERSEWASSVHCFHPYLELWDVDKCGGVPPPGLYTGACAPAGHLIYLYGGSDGSRYQNSLHQLDTRSWTWKELSRSGPTSKVGCGLVACDSKLVLFGGYGYPSGPTQPGAEFIKDSKFPDGRGWTNEVHTFNLKEGTWSSSTLRGTRPPPCSYFSLTMIDDHRAVLFGGNQPERATEDGYILDLTGMHFHSSKLDNQEGAPCPVARNGHAAVCLDYGGDYPQLLVIGGKDAGTTLSDAWTLDVQSGRWREVNVRSLQSRCYHSAAAFRLNQRLTEVTIFGGCPEWPTNLNSYSDVPRVANTTVLRFESQQCPSTGGPPTREWILTDIADSTQLGTRERMRAKVKKIQATRTVAATEDGRREESNRRIREAERRAREAERKKEDIKREKEIAERQAREAGDRAREAGDRAREAGDRAREAQRGKEAAQRELQRLQTQWVVERREIHLTDQELGRGAWATVSVAMFRGARVAAKCVHNQIVSQRNIQLFKREMDMAARIRHPNLLLFIGATLEGEMVILTELMPTSLRRELEREYQMSPRLTISIGLDVAKALNYLHLMRPHPLIHRDISSANVLLERPLINGHCRAKVSDYGTVNLQEKLATIGPGSPCYAAPEANDPTQQSPKMDIFCFGALLMEMLSGELPARDERARLMGKINHQPLLDLIQRCLKESKQERPNASDIISELEA